ncbi:lumican-like [Arctopsyche grandis]|uniref:lumican-like n=1 Tax=Arctopsyche grandis TaxID=121162 RepID=UPI00406D7657
MKNKLSGMKQWNGVMPVIIFVLSFVMIIPAADSYSVANTLSKIQNENTLNSRNAFLNSTKCTKSDDNSEFQITCSGLDVNDNLTALIELLVWNEQIQTIDFLIVEKSSFEDGKLAQNWIDTTNFRIKMLQITSSMIDKIENNAFTGYAFEELLVLRLWYLKIETLEEGTFAGLQQLQNLFINTCEIKYINENALKPVASTLESLSLFFMTLPFNPVNLTGTVPLPNLRTVNFPGNNFKNNLNAKSFSQLKTCEYLDLNRCRIEDIGYGTFANMLSMRVVDLAYNPLTGLDYCVFGDEVIKNFGTEGIQIGFNLWNCDCDLDWLKKLRVEKIVGGDARCASHSNKTFEQVIFCDEETENPTCFPESSTESQSTTNSVFSMIGNMF